MEKYTKLYKKSGLILAFLLISVLGFSQIIVEEPVFTEDFGTVPDNWKSKGNDYSDGNISTYRQPVSRGNAHYDWAKRRKEFIIGWVNKSLNDFYGNGKYAVACNGKEIGDAGTWHAGVDHTGNANGLALVVNGATSANTAVYDFTIDAASTNENLGLKPDAVYQFKVYIANVEAGGLLSSSPNVVIKLDNGEKTIEKPTGDITGNADQIPWIEHIQYVEIKANKSLKYTVISVNKGLTANIFSVDDIALSPVHIKADMVNIDFCSQPGMIFLEAQLDNKPLDLPVYARLMRLPATGGAWEWVGNYQDSLKFTLSDADYHNYKYRVALGLTTASFEDAGLLNEATPLNAIGTSSVTENFVPVYTCDAWSNFALGLKFCEDPAMAIFKGDKNALPVAAPLYSRLMQRPRGSESEWEWKGVTSDTLDVRTDALDYLTYEYRVAHEIMAPDLLNQEHPKTFMESDDHGCFIVKDTFRNDFCLNLFGVDIDYVSVADSVVVNLQMAEIDKPVYLRWLYRSSEAEGWKWLGESKPATDNKIDWITFTTGDFRGVYAMNPALLNAMSDTAITTKDYYYAATEENAIKGISLTVEVRKTFAAGGVILEAVTDKMPSVVAPVVKGFWLQRPKGTGHWQRLEGFEQRMGVVEYTKNEYRFVASMSQAVIDTLNTDALTSDHFAYWVSDTIKGETVYLHPNTVDYCEVPGEAMLKADFASDAMPAEMPAIGRWMYREKDTPDWIWISNFSGIKDLQIPMNEFLTREYQLIVAWDGDSLNTWTANGLPEKQDYYLLQNQFVDVPFCLTVDTIRITSQKRDELILQPQYTPGGEELAVYGRWMRKPKDSEAWEWLGESQKSNYTLTVATDEFAGYDYRFNMALAPVVLEATPADLIGKGYCPGKQIQGQQIFKPLVAAPQITCVAHRDSNLVVVTIQNPEQVKSLTYRIGKGEIRNVRADLQMDIQITLSRDSAFYLLNYAQQGICDTIVRNDTINLKYLPKLQITRFTDAFGCYNTFTKLEPAIIGGENIQYQWYIKDRLLPEQEDTLKILFDEVGTVPLKLRVGAPDRCPEDSTVYLITGDYPRIAYQPQTTSKEVCVGSPFGINYERLDAEQYRVTLKETSMPGYIFYPGTGDITVTENGTLNIKSLQSNLLATDFMVGHTFTFRIQIFKVVEYRGISYRCEDSFEYSFRVRPAVTSPYPSYLKLCGNEKVSLSPEIQLNENQVSAFRWRVWDGTNLSEQEVKNSPSDYTLDVQADGNWNGKRLQLTALCECGEIVVQDINLMVFVSDSNKIVGPDQIVLSGEKVNIEGTSLQFRDMEYVWEKRKGAEPWQQIKDERDNSLAFYAPDTTSSYRRLLVGEGWNCPGLETQPVIVNIFNNKTQNRIYIQDRDTLIVAGTMVTIHSDVSPQEEILYRWEKYSLGAWENIPGENGPQLTCSPEEITKYRRIALFEENELYSNELIINVYSRGQNRILLANAILTPGEKVHVLGNYVGIQGVRYAWYANDGKGWVRLSGQSDCNVKMPLSTKTKFVRYAYLPSQPKDSVLSNEVIAYVFDNTVDNRISCEALDVCAEEQIKVSGVKVEGEGEGISYRWEYSIDEGTAWIVLNNELSDSYTFKAEQNILLRRRVQYTDAPEYYSNILAFNVIHNSVDNRISQNDVAIAGQTMTIFGTEVPNASYRWEQSPDGQNDWQLLEGFNTQNLQLDGEKIIPGIYLRRQLLFAGGYGCNAISNILKIKIFDIKNSNVITASAKPVCQWGEFTITGTDLSDLEAKYQWQRNKGQGWENVQQAITKDLTVYEGCGHATLYRREVVIEDLTNLSNEQQIRLWNDIPVNNTLRQPGIICSGQAVTIEGSDAFAGEMDFSSYLKLYSWEKSQTGAGSTWTQVDTLNTRDLLLNKVEEPGWYRRVIKTYCGNDLQSEPLFLEVKEAVQFTLRNDAPFGSLNPKEPIKISIDQNYFRSYEIVVDGKTKVNAAEYLFYGWMPKKKYEVVANVVASTGCVQTDTMTMYTPDVDLPNVLTPNNDNYNDILLKGYDLKVYNRWGNLVYSGKEGWDGKYKGVYVAAGTYFYILKITHIDGGVSEYRKSVTVKRD